MTSICACYIITTMQDVKSQIEEKLKEIIKSLGVSDVIPSLEIPKDNTNGDYASNVAMQLTKVLKKNPMEIAEEISSQLTSTSLSAGSASSLQLVDKIEVAKPGFINFHISKDYYKDVIKEILESKEEYGKSDSEKGRTWLIEHTSPNPNKEYHLGHLKNTVTGLSVSYLIEALGAKVYRDCIDNNRGIAIAKLMWGYLKFERKDENTPIDLAYWHEHQNEWFTPEEKNLTPGKFVDKIYVLGSDDFKKDPNVEEVVRKFVVDWEAEDPKNHALWKKTQEWVWKGYEQSLNRVDGWKFDKIWHESEIYKKGKEHVYRGLEEGIFKKLEDGAIITDLKKDFGLTDTVLIKKDGTALYITQDLELSYLKRKEFNPDEMVWIIGPEQSLAMKQMFAACSQLGFGKYEDYHHIPYGFILVKGKDGKPEKMSSRNGTQISVNDLIDQAKAEIKKLITTEDLSDNEKEEISEKVAIGAIKYSLLKVNRLQDMVFDFATSISLEGDSGPYLLYTYTRAKSVLRQANELGKFEYENNNVLNDSVEVDLIKHLYAFKSTIIDAAKNYAPNAIALYLYELAQKYNKFYNSLSILKAENEELKQSRLALTSATAQVLKNGLNLLGIETVERM